MLSGESYEMPLKDSLPLIVASAKARVIKEEWRDKASHRRYLDLAKFM